MIITLAFKVEPALILPLALLVQEALRDPHGGGLYVFLGKSGKLIKIPCTMGSVCRSMQSGWSARRLMAW
ncbi:hypothetical protein ACNJYD_09370 [Bradyrhizobium sp. DASA03005]|uniref:hypothetical protein n=1 Tax=Bradyrhizobium sp. SPXBL-02 TaxID=3395912 RepID=UPI003F6E59E6